MPWLEFRYVRRCCLSVGKDVELMTKGKVEKVIWTFFESPVTGKAGANKPLQEALQKAGIETQIIRKP